MGFSYVGANRAIARIEDRKERREQFLMELMERRKAVLIPELMKRYDETRAIQKAKTERLSTARSYGLSTQAAAILESSGELDRFISDVSQIKDLPTSRVRDLSEAIVSSVPKEKAAQALRYALDTGVIQDPTSDGLIDVLYANTDEDLTSAFGKAMSSISGPTADRPGIAPVDVNIAALRPIDSQETARIRKNLEQSLKGILEYTISPDNQIIWNDPASAVTIIDNAVKYYAQVSRDPLVRADPIDIVNQVTDSVLTLKNKYGVDYKDIAENYQTFPLVPLPKVKNPLEDDNENLTLEEMMFKQSPVKDYTVPSTASIDDYLNNSYIE